MSVERGYALAQAEHFASRGYKLVPIAAGCKYPKGLPNWQEEASAHPAKIKRWFAMTDNGIGWAMGRQPNGSFVFAVDVDGDAGMDSLIQLLKIHGQEAFFNTACQMTGGGGMHFFFTADIEIRNSARQIAPHIDIRGEGGQVVIGPTIHPNGNPYVWQKLPDDRVPIPAPDWLIELIVSEPEPEQPSGSISAEPTPTRSPASVVGVGDDDQSPADWVRENMSIGDMLAGTGWTYMESRGGDTLWCRPGKNPRDGHSAILHGDEHLVVFSTAAPPEFSRVGSDNRDGSISLSPSQVYAACYHGGDFSAAMSDVRRNRMSRRAPGIDPVLASVPLQQESASSGQAETTVAQGMWLPDEFWEARPWLRHIRQAALSRALSPDAVLLSLLGRFAAMVPPTLRLDSDLAVTATLDWMGVVVGPSGGGKSAANVLARELIDSKRTDILWDAPVGSGEGIVESFMGDEIGDDGKKTGRRTYKTGEYIAVHVAIDEGKAFAQMSSRQGTTIVETMLSAWSGQPLGQTNSAIDRRRRVPPGERRVSVTVNMQTKNGHLLMTEALRNDGFANRLVFASAVPEPGTRVGWRERKQRYPYPGPLDIQSPPIIRGQKVTFPDETRDAFDAIQAGIEAGVIDGNLEGHSVLVQMKVSAMLALIDGRYAVDPEDWDLASYFMASSRSVREMLLSTYRRTQEELHAARGRAQAAVEIARDDVKERQAVTRLAERIRDACDEQEWSYAKLRRRITSGTTRHRFDDALARAVDNGWVEVFEVEGQGQGGKHVRRV